MLAVRRAGIGWPFMKAGCSMSRAQVVSSKMQMRGFTYFDDFGKLFRDKERALEAVFILRRERELQVLMGKDTSKLEEAKRACMQIKAHLEAQQLWDGEVNYDAKSALQYMTLRIPNWLGVHQIVHAPP